MCPARSVRASPRGPGRGPPAAVRRNGAHAAISSGSGSRLPGGRHLTTLVMNTSSRCQPMDPMSSVEQATGSTHERPALLVLVLAGPLAHEHHLGVRAPLTRHRVRPTGRQSTAGAAADLGGDGLERRRSVGRSSRWSRSARPTMRRATGTPAGHQTAVAARRDAGSSHPRSSEDLGDLHRVGRGTLADVVRDDPEGEAPAVIAGTCPNGRGPRRCRRCRPHRWPADSGARAGSSTTTTPGTAANSSRRALGRDGLARLDVDRLGVRRHDRHPHGRAGDPQVGQVQDLAALRKDLPLLLGVAVVPEHVDLRQHVERDLVGVHRRDRAALPRPRRAPGTRAPRPPRPPVPLTDW